MKKLLYIILLLPLWVNAQTNGTIQKTSATGTIRGSFGSLGLDTLQKRGIINVRDYGATGNGSTDETAAFNLAISAAQSVTNGRATVYVPGGTYKVDSLNIPDGIYLLGASNTKSVLKASTTATYVLSLASNTRVSNLRIEGNEPTRTYVYADTLGTQSGILVVGLDADGLRNVTIDNNVIIGFNKYAVYSRFVGRSTPFGNGIRASGNVFERNYHGLYLFERSEYGTFVNNQHRLNHTGILVMGGNNYVGVSNFTENNIGATIVNGGNDTHGSFVGCGFNHSSDYALIADGVDYGHKFNSSYFYDGKILIKNSIGVAISDSHIAVDTLFIGGGGINMIDNTTFDNDYGGIVVRNFQNPDYSLLTNNHWIDTVNTDGTLALINNVIPASSGKVVTTTDASVTTPQLITKTATSTAAWKLQDLASSNMWEVGHISGGLYFYNYTSASTGFSISSTNVGTFAGGLTSTLFNTGATNGLNITNSAFSSGVYNVLNFGTGTAIGDVIGIWGRDALNGPVYNAKTGGTHSFRVNNTEQLVIGTNVTISSLGTGAVQATAGVLSVSSDSRLKDVKGVFKGSASAAISRLDLPRYWNYNAKSGLPKETYKVKQFGLLADRVHEVLGEEFAPTQKDGTNSLSDRALLSLAIQAIKELKAEIEILKKK